MNNKWFQIRYWERAYNRLHTILRTSLFEKKFKGVNGERILYVLMEGKGDTMVVCFPGCSDFPKYNYVGSLRDIKCHKLFVKDDASVDKKGNYMIGGGYNDLMIRLINHCVTKTGSTKIIFVGSSKGGYSALNFSLQIPNTYVCVAAPQYRLGTYLYELFKPSLEAIVGETNEDKIKKLDRRLEDMIASTSVLPKKVFFHVSKNEHTWEEHCKGMVADLQKRGVSIDFDFGMYAEHSDLIYHYPSYLKKSIQMILTNDQV